MASTVSEEEKINESLRRRQAAVGSSMLKHTQTCVHTLKFTLRCGGTDNQKSD